MAARDVVAVRERGGKMWNEFKAFAFKGNVVDLAVGVVIGAAFAKIIDSLVKHIIMPLLSLILPGDQTYSEWKVVVNGKDVPYGLFLAEVLNFLIVAFALFIVMQKLVGGLLRARQKEEAATPVMTKEEALLTEIRDLLKANRQI